MGFRGTPLSGWGRPERVFDPAEIASITIFGQTFPLDGLVPVES